MNFVLLRRSIREAALLWGCLAVVLFGFAWIRVWITSQIDTSRVAKMIENAPKIMLDLLPVPPMDLLTYPARVGMSFEEPLVYAMIAIWAIARGSDAVSGKISSGTMELLLAQPVSRLQLLFTQVGVSVVGTALLVVCVVAGLGAGIATNSVVVPPEPVVVKIPFTEYPMFAMPGEGEGEELPISDFVHTGMFVASGVNLFAFGVLLAGLTTLLSACDRYRWRTIGIVAAFLVVQIMVEVVSMSVVKMAWLSNLTVLSLYEPIDMAVRTAKGTGAWAFWVPGEAEGVWVLGPLSFSLILLGMATVAFAASALVFTKRDLPAPL